MVQREPHCSVHAEDYESSTGVMDLSSDAAESSDWAGGVSESISR